MHRMSSVLASSLVLFYSQALWAQGASTLDVTCRPHQQAEVQDPHEIGARLSSESKNFARLCLNTQVNRPVEIIQDSSDHIVFANLYHQGKFWTAYWSKNDIPTAQFVIVYFSVDIPVLNMVMRPAHTEMHFRFSQGLTLVSQTSEETTRLNEVAISWEAVLPHNENYDFLVGVKANYGIVGRAVSREMRIQEISREPGRTTHAYTLNYTPEQAGLVFQNSLKASDKSRLNEFYLTLTNNCTTKPFQIMDEVLKTTNKDLRFQPFYTSLSWDPIAGPARNALQMRQLIHPNQKPIQILK